MPPGVVTVTSTIPAACAGTLALTCVADTNSNVGDAVAPNFTEKPWTKFVPWITTTFPPAVEPALGVTLLTVGGP